MATESAANRAGAVPEPDAPEKAESPTDLGKAGWRFTGRAALAEFQRDQCTDLAARRWRCTASTTSSRTTATGGSTQCHPP